MPIVHCKRELQNLCSTDGHAGKALCVGERHHVAWCFPTLNSCMPVDCLNVPVVVNDSPIMEESAVDNSNMVSCELFVGDTDLDPVEIEDDINNINDDGDSEGNMETVLELTLFPADEIPVIDATELDNACEEMLEDEEEEESFTKKHTFFDLDQDSMKILSYLDLKANIEKKLCYQMCAVERRIGKITMEQKTYKLATVLMFSCKHGHYFSIAPEHVDDKKMIHLITSRSIFISFSRCNFLEKDFAQCPFSLVSLASVSQKEIIMCGKGFRTRLDYRNSPLQNNVVRRTYGKRLKQP